MKKWVAFILCLMLCAALCAPALTEQARPLLWRVTDEAGHEMYLFGSIHIGREDLYPLNDAVMNAFYASDTVACEMDITAGTDTLSGMLATLSAVTCESGKTTKDYMSESGYRTAKLAMQLNGVYNFAYEAYRPYFWYSLLSGHQLAKVGLLDIYGLETVLLPLAKAEGKTILEVEDPDVHMGYITDIEDDMVEYMLTACALSPLAQREATLALYQAWCAGDEEKIYADSYVIDPALTGREREMFKRYIDLILLQRNELMTDAAQQCLLSGDRVFYMVGAAHMVGHEGIAHQLSLRGYTVEEIGR